MIEEQSRLSVLERESKRNRRRNDAAIAFLGLQVGGGVYLRDGKFLIEAILSDGKLTLVSDAPPNRGRKGLKLGRNNTSVHAFQVSIEKPAQLRSEPRSRHD
jgi:hypothetical protein